MPTIKEKKFNTYGINKWSDGYFDIGPSGRIIVKPTRQGEGGDLYKLVCSLVKQGIEPPILIRFNDIIRDRLNQLHHAFYSAIQRYAYPETYRMVYPLKVNPQRHVVETLLAAGKDYQLGLEVGSKPELTAVIALETNSDRLLLCNGYKDAEYISLALMSRQLGHRTIIIIEQLYELKLVLEIADKMGIEAEIGFRMKLSYAGSGRWKDSGGEGSKFGLFAYEIVSAAETLRTYGKSNWLKLLHFHLGSQITEIHSIQKALKEATRVYTELAVHHPGLSIIDVGGGLAVDYDGSEGLSDSSMNYSLEEYALNVVSLVSKACHEAGIPVPMIVTESGRALVAQHAILITEVIDVTSHRNEAHCPPCDLSHHLLKTLMHLSENLEDSNFRESFHTLLSLKDSILGEFIVGNMGLLEKGHAEKLCHQVLSRLHRLFKLQPQAPKDLETIDKMLLETYFCNFSIFQSLPDSWAIDQMFPIMPIQDLHESAENYAQLADLTCDSDGKIDAYIGDGAVNDFITLPPYTGEPYYIGIFAVGAYQEILGGLHNLFGDTNIVHAELSSDGRWELSHLVEGDTIKEVLQYVQYNPEELLVRLHQLIERALQLEKITHAESAEIKKQFKRSLESYTYLVV